MGIMGALYASSLFWMKKKKSGSLYVSLSTPKRLFCATLFSNRLTSNTYDVFFVANNVTRATFGAQQRNKMCRLKFSTISHCPHIDVSRMLHTSDLKLGVLVCDRSRRHIVGELLSKASVFSKLKTTDGTVIAMTENLRSRVGRKTRHQPIAVRKAAATGVGVAQAMQAIGSSAIDSSPRK